MGHYLNRKLEYYRGSMGLLRFYRFWLTILALFVIITMTWKITTSGYNNHLYFFMDLLVGGFAVIGLLSFLPCDRSTIFGNLTFLLAFIGVKGYKTYRFFMGQNSASTSDIAGAGIEGMMDGAMSMSSAGMGSMDMGSMMDMGGAMGGMASATPASPDMGLLGQMVQKLLSGPFKMQGDFSKFIVVTEFELFVVLCIVFMIMFVSQWQFYKTPLAQLRERG